MDDPPYSLPHFMQFAHMIIQKLSKITNDNFLIFYYDILHNKRVLYNITLNEGREFLYE